MGEPDPLVGRVINDRFKITGVLARGGMGKVYRAEQAPLGRACAVKVLNPRYAGEQDPEFHKRFFLEASIASRLTHPNTVTIFDYGHTSDDVYYMAMEYLEGQTLQQAIRAAKHFPEERASHVARQICRALREAHSLGVIHRDLKPANVFLVEHGDEPDFVKVLDFGLVKNVSENKGEDLTQTGLFMGSPKYMAPEQIRGDRVDARTDIYALGVILYEMLTGSAPFDRSTSVNTLMAHVNEEPPPMREMNPSIEVSSALSDAVMRCMSKDPDARFRSMDELLAALKRADANALTATGSGAGATGESRALTASGEHPPASGPSSIAPGGIVSPLLPFSESGAPVVAPTPRARPRGLLATSMIAVVAAVGLVAWFVTHASIEGRLATASGSPVPTNAPPSNDPVSPPLLTSARAPEASAMPPAPSVLTSPPPAVVKLRIRTEPEGATVKDDGVEVCNTTPCDHVYQGEDADPAKPHKLSFTKVGYRDEVRIVTLGNPPEKVVMKRVFIPQAPPRTTLPEGFKDFPPPPTKAISPD